MSLMNRPHLRFLVRLFIVFHVLVIFIVPNRESILNADLSAIILPYANQLQINTAWQFFSPDPGPATFLVARVSRGSAQIAQEFLPPEEDEHFFRQFRNRRIAAMRFMGRDPNRATQVWIPYLCAKHPEATTISIEKVTSAVASLESVREGSARLNDISGQRAEFFIAGDCEKTELVE